MNLLGELENISAGDFTKKIALYLVAISWENKQCFKLAVFLKKNSENLGTDDNELWKNEFVEDLRLTKIKNLL